MRALKSMVKSQDFSCRSQFLSHFAQNWEECKTANVRFCKTPLKSSPKWITLTWNAMVWTWYYMSQTRGTKSYKIWYHLLEHIGLFVLSNFKTSCAHIFSLHMLSNISRSRQQASSGIIQDSEGADGGGVDSHPDHWSPWPGGPCAPLPSEPSSRGGRGGRGRGVGRWYPL